MTVLSFDIYNDKDTAGCHLLKKELNITWQYDEMAIRSL